MMAEEELGFVLGIVPLACILNCMFLASIDFKNIYEG